MLIAAEDYKRLEQRLAPYGDCLIFTGHCDDKGYGKIRIRNRTMRAHRVAFAYHNNIDLPPTVFVCHHCDIAPCCKLSHLYAGDALSNKRDSQRRGRSPVSAGECNANARLTWNQVREIRREWTTGEWTQYNLACHYSVSTYAISDILTGRRWQESCL